MVACLPARHLAHILTHTLAMVLALAMILLTACTPSLDRTKGAGESSSIAMRFADDRSAASPTTAASMDFARQVGLASGSRIAIRVFNEAALGEEESVVAQLRFGGIDMARISLHTLGEYSPAARQASLPGAFRDPGALYAQLDGPLGEKIAGELGLEKLIPLAWLDPGPLCVTGIVNSVDDAGDLGGLRLGIRQSRFAMALVESLGATPMVARRQELRRLLDNRYLDGYFETLAACVQEKNLAPGRSLAVFDITPGPELIVASKVTFMKLGKDDRQFIESMARQAALEQRKVMAGLMASELTALSRAGLRIHHLSGEELGKAARDPSFRGFGTEDR